jgi:hypothetical protein
MVHGGEANRRTAHLLESLNTAPKQLFFTNANKQKVQVSEPRLNLVLCSFNKETSLDLQGIIKLK